MAETMSKGWFSTRGNEFRSENNEILTLKFCFCYKTVFLFYYIIVFYYPVYLIVINTAKLGWRGAQLAAEALSFS